MPRHVRYVKAPQKGTDVAGRVYAKGDPIIWMSSDASTGQTYVITPESITELMKKPADDFKSAEEMADIKKRMDETKAQRTMLYASFNSLKKEVEKLNPAITNKMYYNRGQTLFRVGFNKSFMVGIKGGEMTKVNYYGAEVSIPLSDPNVFTKFAALIIAELK